MAVKGNGLISYLGHVLHFKRGHARCMGCAVRHCTLWGTNVWNMWESCNVQLGRLQLGHVPVLTSSARKLPQFDSVTK